ncbi:Sigma-54 interaction domain protein [Clostridiales bacterium oral taxon 876 str. F0540]|nr:Sigma-54 interaction domain protein [Clostridiales bacterium oral taxon 876 str. F0540]
MLKYSLMDIKEYVLKLAELIAEVIRVDVEIVDKSLTRIAGTGRYGSFIGKSFEGESFIYKRVIESGRKLVVENPGFHRFCADCRMKHSCAEKFECCTPVIIEKEVVGVIALICFTDEQKKIILAKLKEYSDFLDKMAELIASKAKENYEELQKEKIIAQSKAETINEITLNSIIGEDNKIKELKSKLINIADSYANILFTGESGCGKELFARAVHYESRRRNFPFIAVNCGAIPEALLESELFGYAAGAFTGASRTGKIGKFELANKGTIFLDEIGDMPVQLQVKLLRVLQDRIVIPVGSNKPVRVDVRVITATNKNLDELIKTGSFREDLYYRINVIPLEIPPLRDRKGDIVLIFKYLLYKYCSKYKIEIPQVSSEVIRCFQSYSWFGNVRELENTVEYVINMLEGEKIVKLNHLPCKLLENKSSYMEEQELNLEMIERKTIIRALKKYGTNTEDKRHAAKALGISLASLYRKINNYRIAVE